MSIRHSLIIERLRIVQAKVLWTQINYIKNTVEIFLQSLLSQTYVAPNFKLI